MLRHMLTVGQMFAASDLSELSLEGPSNLAFQARLAVHTPHSLAASPRGSEQLTRARADLEGCPAPCGFSHLWDPAWEFATELRLSWVGSRMNIRG